ncbi:MAG TPA: SPOR domain-containing protein [Allosphingosinicella sp.]|jgi:hypothetical protein|nr:SPOR domain-containing protein [Allosphingosinicella sp.]
MSNRGFWLTAAAVAFAAPSVPLMAQTALQGISAWQAGRYEEAVRIWRPLADRGDADAQFNLGHAYRLGRGVPQNMNMAEQLYSRAARSGHVEASAMYGLILFQNGRREEAMPLIRRAAEAGDARAQYVYGTALFNGDLVPVDWPRAYAFISRAAAQGLPYAQSRLREMEQHLTPQDRARGTELAQEMARTAPVQVASNTPPPVVAVTAPPAPPPPRIAGTNVPPSSVATDRPAPPPSRPAPPATRPAPAVPALASSGGRWRVQLGAFSTDANARRAWSQVAGRLGGLQPFYVRAGAVIRLQAGPLASRAAAERACAAARQACFPVAP